MNIILNLINDLIYGWVYKSFLKNSFGYLTTSYKYNDKQREQLLPLFNSAIIIIFTWIYFTTTILFFTEDSYTKLPETFISRLTTIFLLIFYITELEYIEKYYIYKFNLIKIIHHVFYSILMIYIYYNNLTSQLMLMTIMYIPNIFISLYKLNEGVHIFKILYITSFFILRVLYNAIIIVYLISNFNFIIKLISITTLVFHIYWFVKIKNKNNK